MSERVIYKGCPLCKSENIQFHKEGDCSNHPLYYANLKSKIIWKKCDACAHVFTEGYYTDEICKVIFSKTNDNQKVGGDVMKNRFVSAKMIERVVPYVKSGPWLDIGFGNGSLLFTAQEYGFEPIGVDLRQENVNIMNALGIKSYCEDIANLKLDKKCSVISMCDVLEHVPYPQDMLKAINSLIDENGVLLISLPNSEHIVWEMMNRQNANPYWGEMEHYHNFSRTQLYDLLRGFGFQEFDYGISARYQMCMEVIARK